MLQLHDVITFRKRYREAVRSHYNGWFHLTAIVLICLGVSGYCIVLVDALRLGELLAVPLGILLYNFMEYAAHRWAGHKKQKLTRLFYNRHTGDHHSFYSPPLLSFASSRDWRIVLFPTYLSAFLAFILAPFCGYLLASLFSVNAGYILAAVIVLSHLGYEVLHLAYHQSEGHWFHNVPGLRELAHLHRIHHRRELMKTSNFNLTLPLFDLLLGTFHWEPRDTFDGPGK
ncbi:sterol desaturase family protein [Microbulbifer sp. 2205BS26-8]|uniref:sterol desaturase family protein n=1 Tax=Microbulbifer sp. 2205BS26-8 TaxID=3064386 RepID=UPI002740025A|nr:sterol desaturase family protein [Microbulbifer sp. 2205BS26-8]MDP5209289.1 sterol desaturase family protein [Microbulbifer sp. 2205BS26-8]